MECAVACCTACIACDWYEQCITYEYRTNHAESKLEYEVILDQVILHCLLAQYCFVCLDLPGSKLKQSSH